MEKKLILIIGLLATNLCYGQSNPKEYNELIRKSTAFVRLDDYKNAALSYAAAFRIIGSKPSFEDRYNAACSWSLANYPDSAINQLSIIADINSLRFSGVHELFTDSDLTAIMKDARLGNIRTRMFVKSYNALLNLQKEAGVTTTSFKQDDTVLALALGYKNDSAISHVNDGAYRFLRNKNYEKAFRLFELSIGQFPPHYILYRNIVDYYLAVGDTLKAYTNFARSEQEKFVPDSIVNSQFKIDSAITADYNILSKEIGQKVLPPSFLMSNFSTSKLRKDVSNQIIDTSLNTVITNPAHPIKHPVVGYDEGHRNAFRVTTRMKAFGKLLQNHGYEIIVDTGRFTQTQLSKYDILITGGAIGNFAIDSFPQAYTPEEIEAVRTWVVRGGSLLLMTDHPPFDTSVSALVSGLGSKIGVGIVLDSMNTFKPLNEQVVRSGWVIFSKENKGLGNHSILLGRNKLEQINKVMTQGGSSVTGPLGSTNILSLSKTAENQMHRTFVGPTQLQAAQMVAYKLGKGRVVITADGTMFSAQTVILQDGGTFGLGISRTDFDNKQLALNVMHWLSGAIK